MILAPNMIYIEFNNVDKRVTFTHFNPMMMLEEGMSDEVKNSPSAKEAYLQEAKTKYEAIGKFIPRENYEIDPQDGFKYRQVYNSATNKVTYEKISDQTPVTTELDAKITELNQKIKELDTAKERLVEAQASAFESIMEIVTSNTETITSLLETGGEPKLPEEGTSEA